MAKKSVKGPSQAVSKGKSKAMTYSDISEDEIDRFHNQREKILLGESEDEFGSENSFDEEALMDLPSDEGEYSEDDVLFEGETEEEKEETWGKSKKSFYSNDHDALDEEASEAKKLQKKRFGSMKMEDFTGGKKVSASKKSGPVSLDLSDAEDQEVDEDEDGKECSELEPLDEFELDEEQIATLSADEKIALISKHSDEFTALVSDFKERLGYLESTLKPLIAQLKDLPTSEGLSFLKVKHQLLTAYCTNVAFYLHLKLSGKSIQNHPVLDKLVKFRLLLEKIKPMENKLRYQVDRLLKVATGQVADDEAEAGKFRPNPDMLLKADGDDSEEDEEGDGRYKAPKLAPMHYPEDENAVSRKHKHEEYLRKVNASNRLIQDIKAEFEDAPEEEAVDVVYGGKSRPGRKEQDERDRYEEENYMRFTLDKKAKSKLKNHNKAIDELEDLNDFIEELGGKKSKGNKRSHQNAAAAVFEAPPKRKSKEPTAFPSDESDVEDDFYQKVMAAKQSKSNRPAKERAPIKFRSDVDLEGRDTARPANWKMMKNKGLVTSRSKETNNPRVRQRKKFERAEKRLGSYRAVNKGQAGKYGGEDSGIRTNIVRSTKF